MARYNECEAIQPVRATKLPNNVAHHSEMRRQSTTPTRDSDGVLEGYLALSFVLSGRVLNDDLRRRIVRAARETKCSNYCQAVSTAPRTEAHSNNHNVEDGLHRSSHETEVVEALKFTRRLLHDVGCAVVIGFTGKKGENYDKPKLT